MIATRRATLLGVAALAVPLRPARAAVPVAAQASGAKVIGLANAGTDAANCVKQAREFGLTQGGARWHR